MHETQRHFDVIVVGAGFGGSTVAACLAERGRRVLLLDKNRRAGGKAITVHRSQARYELWPIAGGPAENSRFDELAQLLGAAPEQVLVRPDQAADFIYLPPAGTTRAFTVPARAVQNPFAVVRLLGRIGVPPWRLGGFLAMCSLTVTLPHVVVDRLDTISFLTWMRRFRLPPPVLSYMAALVNLLFVVPVDRLPASEALHTLRDFYWGGAGRYHAGGYGQMAELAAHHVAKRGGSFLPSTRVQRVCIDDGRATGVHTTRGHFTAPVVISNAGIQPTVLRLVGTQQFAPRYVEHVMALQPSLALAGVRYHLSEPVFDRPMSVVFSDDGYWTEDRYQRALGGHWPRHPLLFVTVPSLYDRTLAGPSSPQIALLGVISSPDPRTRR